MSSCYDRVGIYAGSVSPKSDTTLTWRRYRSLQLEYSALKVVGRGLFLAMMLMVVFLFVFVRATDLVAGENEVIIPTLNVAPSIDLGELATGSFSRTSASVVSLVGIVMLIVSAPWTSHALRTGTALALRGDEGERPRWRSWQTLAIAVALPAIVLTTWLLTLATSLRRRAWSVLLGRELDPALVNVGKGLAITLSLLLVFGVTMLVVRVTTGHLSGRAVIAGLVIGAVTVGCNFVLLYTYVGSLINPNVSGGIVLVFALLLWVNIVVRVYLGVLCWASLPKP